ncbi:hypothetical protein HY493_04575 [Candidatus Woesearchaeota archaeon]|nr:hypothetical protein [Candidatus Woesearchaeota archaeon]
MVTKKDRRHSGYVTPDAMISKKELERNHLVVEPFYDDWSDYRDGARDWSRDFKKIKKFNYAVKRSLYGHLAEKRMRMNKKQSRLLRIRKARKDLKDAARANAQTPP